MAATQKTEMLHVRISTDTRKQLEEAAKPTGLSLSEWIRSVLTRAANEGAFAPRKGDKHEKGRKRTKSRS